MAVVVCTEDILNLRFEFFRLIVADFYCGLPILSDFV